MSESEPGPGRGTGGTSPLRVRPPEVTRLNRTALVLIMVLAAVTVLVAVNSMNGSRVTNADRADSAVARLPIVSQRPALPPLHVIAPRESIAPAPAPPPVPPVIAYEQQPGQSTMGVTFGRPPARSESKDQGAAYRRALTRDPLILDRRPEATVSDSVSAHARAGEAAEADVERALLTPLLKNPGGLTPNSAQSPVMASDGVGNVSGVSQRAALEHREFLAESRRSALAPTVTSLEPASSPYELTAGTAIDAALVTEVNSDLPGTVEAQVTRDVFDSRLESSVLVPRGSRLIGRYDDRIVPGQSRVLVAWTRLLFPDGRSVELPGVEATDAGGAAGVPGHINSHLARVFENAAVLSVLSAGAELSQPRTGGSVFTAPSVGQTIGAAAGEQFASLGTEMVRQGLSAKPTIIVPAGSPVAVLLADDLVFQGAYQDTRLPTQ